ncbi:MAG: excinuclease ABC subunit B, partial [Aquificae bacterium]|nr:excinuclease ABC subunit B [Aquificota bacterium]
EGFLRSYQSLIQTIGRAARNVRGKAILYADRITESMKKAIEETERRRRIQLEYNRKHGIKPKPIKKPLTELLVLEPAEAETEKRFSSEEAVLKEIQRLERKMWEYARNWEFEKAARLRDRIQQLKRLIGLA